MDFCELIHGLGQTLGIELSADSDQCALEVDGMQVVIQLVDGVDLFCVYGEIGEPPPQGLEQLLSAMLNANHLFQGTAGSTISRDPGSGKFYLCRCDSLGGMTVDELVKLIERFVNVLETWRRLLLDYRPNISSETSDEQRLPFGGNGFMAV